MLVTDSLVHELDSVPWLAGSPLRSVEVRYPRPSSLAPPQLREPILALLELESGVLADVEMNVDIRFGYQVTAEAVFERGVARIGQPSGLQEWREGRTAIAEHTGFVSRFRDAYDRELQAWVDAARAGGIAGPSAWDGLLAALACEAGVRALQGGAPQVVARPERPTFYTEPR
jgi:myo-inositol 2-dehydrogenase/D-chiro-inositol 1-dehydrogenase